ncbi:MAG: BrnT family toxin [Alphaproteobacteria bacterium]|nr:BrnT family toxin [Alphaproteobacteria bacterium]
MGFEWDERKRRRNLAAHGIDFVAAASVFDGPTLEFPDDREDYGEERVVALGVIGLDVLVVVYTWRAGRRRLISARRATSDETYAYFQTIHDANRPNEG